MVTNALRHSGSTAIAVGVRATSESLLVEVYDGSHEFPVPRPADLSCGGGFGLGLVDRLSSEWGSEPAGPGKRVWFRLDGAVAPEPGRFASERIRLGRKPPDPARRA